MKLKLLMWTLLSGISNYLVAQATNLSPDDFEKGLSAPKVQLLDVRTAGEYQNAHIKNALLADWVNFDEFKERVQYLEKNEPILVYCASGGRSSAAATWLRKNGFSDIRELKGGITAWKTTGKPTEGIPAIKQLSMEEYAKLTTSHHKVLVDFGAEWCPPCKKMEPVLSQLQKDMNGDFNLAKVDAGIHTGILKQLNIETIPTFVIYRDGKEVWRNQGVIDINELKKHLRN